MQFVYMLTVRVNDKVNIKIPKYGCAMTQRSCLDDIMDFKACKVLLKSDGPVWHECLECLNCILTYLNEFNKFIHGSLSFFVGDFSCRGTGLVRFEGICISYTQICIPPLAILLLNDTS